MADDERVPTRTHKRTPGKKELDILRRAIAGSVRHPRVCTVLGEPGLTPSWHVLSNHFRIVYRLSQKTDCDPPALRHTNAIKAIHEIPNENTLFIMPSADERLMAWIGMIAIRSSNDTVMITYPGEEDFPADRVLAPLGRVVKYNRDGQVIVLHRAQDAVLSQ